MTTLALKFASPMQAWPAHGRGTTRPTHGAPTYSALCGLVRCGLGMSRGTPGDPLADTSIILRIDRVGLARWDYHSINPMPSPDRRFSRQRSPLANMEKMSGGPHHDTVLTNREYLNDASFLCLIEADDATVAGISEALEVPRWQLFLGRKSCVPTPDLVLGLFDRPARSLLREVPVVSRVDEASLLVEAHSLSQATDEPDTRSVSWADQPAGDVGAEYQTRMRYINRVEVPVVKSASEQRQWVQEHRREQVAS